MIITRRTTDSSIAFYWSHIDLVLKTVIVMIGDTN